MMAMSSCGPSSFSSSSSSSVHTSISPSLPSLSQQPPPMKGFARQILGLAQVEIDPNFLCGHCEELLRDPVQASCGHRFCQTCLNRLIEGHTGPVLCPQCRREGIDADGATIDTDRFPDKAIKRLMGKLRVVCANAGCPWKGTLVEYSSHEEACPVALVACPHQGCDAELPRYDLAAHVVNQCQRRPVACKYCSSPVPLAEMEKHFLSCPSANKSDDDDDIPPDPSSWKSGRGCPFGCHGRWHSPESYHAHATNFSSKHLERLNRRVTRLETTPLSTTDEPGSTNTPVVGSPSSQLDSEMEDMDETGPGVVPNDARRDVEHLRGAAPSSSGAGASGADSARLEVDIQRLSDRLRMLESERLIVRSDSAPSSSSSNSPSANQQIPALASSGFAFNAGGTSPRPVTTVAPREDVNATAMRKLELCFRKAETYEGMAMVLNVSLDRLLTQVTEIDNQRRRESESREAQERKIQQLEHALALKDVAIADQLRRLELMECTSYNGVLVWKISNFLKKKQDAMSGTQPSIYSPCFYTSRFGYKMCARIYLNGDGMGKGKYVSLFFVIMRSQYDALLTWPFRQKVTLMLLDQGPTGEHVVDAFRPDPNSSSFKRPVSEMNIASGCPLFVPLNLLESNRTYIKDDTAFVKIIVDTQGLQE